MILKANPVLRNAVRMALYAGIASTAVLSVPVFAADEDTNEVDEEVVVTGSRIQRSTLEQSSDVVTLGQAEIEATGSLMVADVLRGSPLNSYGSLGEQSGNTAGSNATINLRGLGSERTLVLVNGRRVPGSPNLGASSVNINMLPMAAVERIDILPNSASAVYGSDAEAGVVNIILKKNFEGFELAARHGERYEDSGQEEGASLVGGASNDQGNVTYAIEWNRRDAIFDRDRDYTVAKDFGDFSWYGKNVELWDEATGYYDLTGAKNNCPEDQGFSKWYDAYCKYDYAAISANKASLNRFNTYIDTNYELADNVEFFATAIFSRSESSGRYAPPAAPWENMPADYRDNPFDIDALLADGSITEDYELTGYYRWTPVGNRDSTFTDTQYDVVGGFRGDITDDLSYEVYAQYDRYDSSEQGHSYLSYPGLERLLNNGQDPFDPANAADLRTTTSQDNYTIMSKYFGQLQWTAGDYFDAGEMIVLGGAEYFEIDYQNKFDAMSEAGNVGGSAGNSSSGDRDVTAFFVETIVPLPMDFELDAALRYDDYSDFGDNWSPSLGLTWQAMDNLALRTHWGTGFAAPALSSLYGPDTFSAEFAVDYVSCDRVGISPEDCVGSDFDTQYTTYYSSNPDLDAETSTSWSLGANWEFYDGWTADLSYWNIEIDDVISGVSVQSIFNAETAGADFSDPNGDIYVDRKGYFPEVFALDTVNSGELNVDGIDFQLRGLVDTSYGMWTPGFLASYTNSYEQSIYVYGPAQETAGFYLQPEWKWQFILGWNLNNHYVDMTVDYIGESADGEWVDISANGEPKLVSSDDNIPSVTTLNASYKYETEKWGAFKIGGRNLTNEHRALEYLEDYSGDMMDLYDNTGRVIYAEYTLRY